MSFQDLFWRPSAGEIVALKPEEAARWPFESERDKGFLVTKSPNEHDQCWITPEDPKRRWHYGPVPADQLLPRQPAPAPQGEKR